VEKVIVLGKKIIEKGKESLENLGNMEGEVGRAWGK